MVHGGLELESCMQLIKLNVMPMAVYNAGLFFFTVN
jgi:hypothetical protein